MNEYQPGAESQERDYIAIRVFSEFCGREKVVVFCLTGFWEKGPMSVSNGQSIT
jgi:hypothetical protein